MEQAFPESQREEESDRIILGLLNSVEQNGARSQRHFAAELGIALGLVNAYLNRCIKKGLVKASQAPARRYAYYLTPQGFSEKSRLTVEYLSSSFGFFRKAKADCIKVLEIAKERNFKHLALLGVSDLAEIAAICAIETDVSLLCTIDPSSQLTRFVGLPVVREFDDVGKQVDGIIVTALVPSTAIDALIEVAHIRLGSDAVLIPDLVALRAPKKEQSLS